MPTQFWAEDGQRLEDRRSERARRFAYASSGRLGPLGGYSSNRAALIQDSAERLPSLRAGRRRWFEIRPQGLTPALAAASLRLE